MSCFGVRQVWFSGDRVSLAGARKSANLSAAVYTVLYDRHARRVRAGLEEPHALAETRGFDEPGHMAGEVGVR